MQLALAIPLGVAGYRVGSVSPYGRFKIWKSDGWDTLLDLDSEGIFVEIVNSFLRPDNVDPIKFKANYEILKHKSRELYKSYSSLRNEQDLSEKGTATIDKLASIGSQPLGYERWFISAYPDVVNWFQNVKDTKILEMFGNPNENEVLNEDKKIKNEYLRKIVAAFIDSGNKLETSM